MPHDRLKHASKTASSPQEACDEEVGWRSSQIQPHGEQGPGRGAGTRINQRRGRSSLEGHMYCAPPGLSGAKQLQRTSRAVYVAPILRPSRLRLATTVAVVTVPPFLEFTFGS